MIALIKNTLWVTMIPIILVGCQSQNMNNKSYIQISDIQEFNTEERPQADARGIITYDKYQVLIANGEETIEAIASRLNINAERFALYNGLIPTYRPRKGELLALHKRIGGQSIKQSNDWSESSTKNILNNASSKFNTKISVPSNPIKHRVESGQTAYSIARLYKVSVTSLAKWNGLDPEFTVYPGRELIIPVPSLKDVKTKIVKNPIKSVKKLKAIPKKKQPKKSNPVKEVEESKKDSLKDFIMPLTGNIIKKYNSSGTKENNEGIDIEAPPGTSVVSSGEGTVALVTEGTGKIGKIILIKHKNNYISLYARISNVLVQKNQVVNQGQKIGTTMVSTEESNTKTTTLHFEIRKGTKSVNPELYFK